MSSSRIYALIFTAVGSLAVLAALVYYAPIDRVAAGLVFAMGLGLFVGAREQWLRLARLEQQIAKLRLAPSSESGTGDEELDAWVEARANGATASLPSASYAPFLVGLFVMLGLLGTFLGLFDTLRGARMALTAAADPQAMRDGLTAPMLGLTRSFGCSATGVTTSVCLGLVGMIVRGRESELTRLLQRVVARRLQGRNPSARVESLLESLAAKFDGVVGALAGMGTTLDTSQKESLVRLEGSLSRHTEALGGLQATLTEGHARELARMGDALLAHADKVASPLLLQGDKLFGQMDGALKSVVEAEARMTQALAEASGAMTQTLGRASEDVAKTLSSATTGMAESLSKHTSEVAQSLSAATGGMVLTLSTSAREVSESLSQTTSTLQRTLSEAHHQQAEALLQHQATHLSAQREAALAFATELAQAQQAQRDALAGSLGTQLQALEAHLPRVIAPLEATTLKMNETALAHANTLQDTTRGLSDALGGSATGITDALLRAAAEMSSALVNTTSALTDTMSRAGEQMTALMAERSAQLASTLSEGQSAQQAALQAATAAQTAALADALAQQLATLESHVERVLAPLEGTTRGIAESVGGHADALRDTMHAVTTAAQEARSGEALHVDTVRELVTVAREGLVSVKVGGAELEAAAAMFTAAAAAHQEGARAWLGSLDAVDERVRQSGKAAAAEALQKQLEYTHKIFGEQLRLHRELFEEVRGAQRVKEHLVDARKDAEHTDGV